MSIPRFQSPLEGVLYMHRLGYKVFPIHPNSKKPAVTGWQRWAQEDDEAKIQAYGAAHPESNWAVSCGASDLWVLDVDNKGGVNGPAHLSGVLSLKEKELPKTLTVKTPSGGIHYYFLGKGKGSIGAIEKGIDTKSIGGYVLAPGSRINGKIYEVEDPAPVAPRPEWLYALSIKKDQPPAPSVDCLKDIPLNQPHHIAAVINYLTQEAPESVENQGGNNTLYVVACMVKNLGISDLALAKELIAEHYDLLKCHPSWLGNETDRAQWEATIRSAYQGSQEPAGSKTQEARDAQAKLDFSADSSGPKHISQYKGEAPERKWLIKGWIPLGEISSLYGIGGIGKSQLTNQLAISVSSGADFLGLKVEQAIPVLCVFCEDSDAELHRRKNEIVKAPEFTFSEDAVNKAPLYFWARVGEENDIAKTIANVNDIEEGRFKPTLEKALADMPLGAKLLILDTLSDVYLGSENIRELVNKFIKTHIGGLVKKYDLTVLLLAHPSRTGTNKGDHLSGSTAWENAVRNRLVLFPHKDRKDVIVLKRAKSNYAKRGEEILLKWENGRFRLADPTEGMAENVTLEQAEVIDAFGKYLKVDDRTSLKSLSGKLLQDAALKHIFSGKGLSTVERFVEKALQYPRKAGGTQYRFEEKQIVGEKAKRWVLSERCSSDQKSRGEQ